MITFRHLHIRICDQFAGHTVDLSLRPIVCAWMTTEKKVTSHKLPAPVNLLLRVCVFEGGWGGVGVGCICGEFGGGGVVVDPDCGRLWSPMLPHLVSRTETTGPGR